MIEIFKIGFLSVTLLDLIDILFVTLVFYKVYNVIRGTIASQIFYGLILVLILSFLTQAANFKALGWLLKLLSDIWVIAFVILFQPEIRRLLVHLGRNPFVRIFINKDESNIANIISEAAFELAQHQHGALMVVVRSVGIRGVVESGEIINAKLSKNLLLSIFFPRSALHDGAVIINNDIVEAVRCTLPLTIETTKDGLPLGMRHRAGIGISEQADVISVIVSEETGGISVAENGKLKSGLSKEGLRYYLSNAMHTSKRSSFSTIVRGIKNIFKQKKSKSNFES